jgi:hypothetical protein
MEMDNRLPECDLAADIYFHAGEALQGFAVVLTFGRLIATCLGKAEFMEACSWRISNGFAM